MRTRTGASVTAAAAVAALALSACGGGDVAADPEGELVGAVERVGGWQGIAATFHLDTDEASVLAAFAEEGITPEQARLVVDSSVTVRATAGADLEDTSDDEFEMSLSLGDLDAVDLRARDEELYLRADVDGLLDLFDASGEGRQALEAAVSQAETFGVDFLDEAVTGTWLHLTGMRELGSMVSAAAGAPVVPTPDPREVASIREELTAAFERLLQEEVEVTYIGSEDPGEHLTLRVSGASLLDLTEEVLVSLQPLLPTGEAGVGTEALLGELRAEAGSELADVVVPVEVWLDGGEVSRVGLDIPALAAASGAADEIPAGVERLLVVVDVAEFRGGVSAPDDAIEVDLLELFGRFVGGSGFGAGT